MLSLYLAELPDAGEEHIEEILDMLPPASRDKALSRKGRAAALTALGELIRIRMMESAGAGYEVAYGEHGKPYSPGRRDVAFSISHSGRAAAGALLVGGGDIGIDIERIDRENDVRHERIARRFYTDAERAAIASSDDRAAAFYTVWTRKESYLKYTGDGITRPLSDIDTEHLQDVVQHSRIITAAGGEYALSLTIPACIAGSAGIDSIEIDKIY